MMTTTAADRDRARAWWVRVIGYITAADDRKVEALAEEFAKVRAEAADDALRQVRRGAEENE